MDATLSGTKSLQWRSYPGLFGFVLICSKVCDVLREEGEVGLTSERGKGCDDGLRVWGRIAVKVGVARSEGHTADRSC